jgi:ABC-type Mn2+/Zn2+ transport system permease subunit
MGIVTALAVGLVLLLYKELKIATFDPGLAAAVGSPRYSSTTCLWGRSR